MSIINNVAKMGLLLTVVAWLICLIGAVGAFASDFMITYLFLLWMPAIGFPAMIVEITNKQEG